MTILDLVNECIETLGKVTISVDELETVGMPVRHVKNNLIALKKFFEEQQNKQEKPTETEEQNGE